ncbi:SpaA isopeptide-forming pilin-related protein [Leifsonia sp. C5G2]|uniref:MSCRAMM family protein n=1 Tax=Leifsonia sp. C5G2 TaxID=2735269 RepID=UPI00158479DF|nr:SpaA isopeptide-forming pilin-related protein [Leifsonia sp. C5G2]NUU08082.1 DUF11 domain-containing protein [Leifsonia sp. C5G2]
MKSHRAGAQTPRRRRGGKALTLVVCVALGALLAIGTLPNHFSNAAAIPTVSCDTDPNIFNTGYSESRRGIAADRSVDERWQALGGDMGVNRGYGAVPPGPLNPTSLAGFVNFGDAYVGKVHNAWLSSPFGKAQWISAYYVSPTSGARNQNSEWADFYYSFTFQLDAKVDRSTFRLAMDYYADNTVRGVWVNGVLKTSNRVAPYTGSGFTDGGQLSTVLNGFSSGRNTIVVQVGSAPSAEGFLAQVTSTRLCSSLTVTKSVSGARLFASDQFTVAAADSSGTVASATTAGTGTSATATAVVAPGVYTITDTLAQGSQATSGQYNGTLTCTNRTAPATPVATSGGYPRWQVTLPETPHDYLCTVTNRSKSFEVRKTVNPPPPAAVQPNQKVTYTVVVKNTGGTAFSGIGTDVASFTDDLSRVLDDAKYNGDATNGAVVTGSVLSWKGALAVGGSATITYSVTVNPLGAGDGTLVNTVTGGSPCSKQCTATTSTPVQSYIVEKSASSDHALPGDTVRYTVKVTNTGKVAYTSASPATFNDDLSDVLKDATYNNDASGGATVSRNVLSWSGALPIGGTATITYTVTVRDPARGDRSMVNTVVSAPSGSNCFAGSSDSRCTVTVPIRAGDITWQKVDATPGRNLLSGSAWRLTPKGGGGTPIEIQDCAATPCAGRDEEPLSGGFRLTGLRPGAYELVETRAPSGFLLSTDPISVTVTANGVAKLNPIVNKQVPVPVLPLTGGLGADALSLIGGGLLALTAVLAGIRPLGGLLRSRRRAS